MLFLRPGWSAPYPLQSRVVGDLTTLGLVHLQAGALRTRVEEDEEAARQRLLAAAAAAATAGSQATKDRGRHSSIGVNVFPDSLASPLAPSAHNSRVLAEIGLDQPLHHMSAVKAVE